MSDPFGDAVERVKAGRHEVRIELAGGRTAYEPGETVRGTAHWNLERPPMRLELHLAWSTSGKGDQDSDLVRTVALAAGAAAGRAAFELALPAGPYSFSGKLISLAWHLELVAEPELGHDRVELVIAPDGLEVRLGTPDAAADG